MVPAPGAPVPSPPGVAPNQERPQLLNERFRVHSYDGGSFKSRAQYDVKNALIPVIEPFHCSGGGTKFNLVLKCSEDFTLTHFYVSGPGPRCTEPIRNGLVWVMDHPPKVELLKKYDNMSQEELMEIVKGLRVCSSSGDEAGGGIPDPCGHFATDPTSRETEIELSKWREGRYVVVKFLSTHKDQVNVDVGIVALVGFFGRRAKMQVPLGPWMRRTVRQVWVHPNPLRSTFSSGGWVCDGRDFTGGCRSGHTDFHQTSVYTVTFRCTASGFDLCERCAYDPTLGHVTDASVQSDVDALADPATCKLAVTRIRSLWRRDWVTALPKYIQRGLLDTLMQALHRSTEGGARPEDEMRATTHHPRASPQQQQGSEAQGRQVRRALLQLTTELTQRLLGFGPLGGIGENDIVWALCPEPEDHWDEGRILQLPKTLPDALLSEPVPQLPVSAVIPSLDSPMAATAASASSGAGGMDDATMQAVQPEEAVPPEAGNEADAAGKPAKNCCLVSWRDGQSPVWIPPHRLWKMTAEEEAMTATASLFLEVSKGSNCDVEKVSKYLQQGADLTAVNGEGCPLLLVAVRCLGPPAVLRTLLEAGACPDAAGREGVTPLQQVLHFQSNNCADMEHLAASAEVLRSAGASTPLSMADHKEALFKLRESFGLKMIGALLALQPPPWLPVEVMEVVHLLLRELPLDVVRRALEEPQALPALASLLQHLVGGTDHLGTALVGCRIARAIHARGDPGLQQLVRSHGVLRWAQRLGSTKDMAQCGLFRQPHHDRVTHEELGKEAKALCEELRESRAEGGGGSSEEVESGEEWRANLRLVEVAEAFNKLDLEASSEESPAGQALVALRELLKGAEKGSLVDERCAAYELEKSGLPSLLRRFLSDDSRFVKSDCNERCARFQEVFGGQAKQARKGLVRLMKALHAVIEAGENLPVWRHRRERGLRALTDPVPLRVKPAAPTTGVIGACTGLVAATGKSQVAMAVEPLAPVSELVKYLLRVTPCADEQYLIYCHELVGMTIRERLSGEAATIESFEVLRTGLPLPIHTIRLESTGEKHRLLLSLRDYLLVGLPPPSQTGSAAHFRAALCKLHVVAGSEAYPVFLEELLRKLRGEASPPSTSKDEDAATPEKDKDGDLAADTRQAEVRNEAIEHVFLEVEQVAMAGQNKALELVAEEAARFTPDADGEEGGGPGATAAASVDPSMRVHTLMIAVSDEIPFDLFWPMVRDDILGAIRELCPHGSLQSEDTIQAGVAQSGMGPVAQRLTLTEAEALAARVGHIVQTAVEVDMNAVQELKRNKAKTAQTEAIQVAARVQFSPRSGGAWARGVVVGTSTLLRTPSDGSPERFDIIDDAGALWEQVPRSRVRVPAGRRESPGASAPIQAVLSQADLVRIREHLRRRQEEWAERHAHAGGSHPGGSSDQRPGTGSAGTSARPTSAPVSTGGSARRAPGEPFSRDASVAEVDQTSALEMVHFIEEEGMDDGEFDDEEGDGGPDPGDDGEDDDEDLPLLEPSEGGDSQGDAMPPRGGSGHGRPGDGRADLECGASMEEELRVLEQLRAMEQIISQVLDPNTGSSSGGRSRRGEMSHEDFLGAPAANLRIRMGGPGDGRVETYQIRRANSSRGERGTHSMEAIRGELPSFARAADSSNPTSTLDHPVVERMGAADLAEVAAANAAAAQPRVELCWPMRLQLCFCLQHPKEAEAAAAKQNKASADAKAAAESTETKAARAPATASPPTWTPLPPTWSVLKALQFLQSQAAEENPGPAKAGTSPEMPTAPPATSAQCQKVALENWHLGYTLCVVQPSPREETLEDGATAEGVARGMYPRQLARDGEPDVISGCTGNSILADAIELFRWFKAQGQCLAVEPGLWVSSKLDRKLRHQLEDPLTVATGTLPTWAVQLPRLCPFLFTLKTRKMLLKYTAFGPSFAVHWTQEAKVGSFLRRRATVQTELNAQTDPRKIQELSQELSNIEEHVVRSNFWLGTLQSVLVRFQKGEDLLRQADVAMERVAKGGRLVEVQFDGETGFGIAVTQSFYVEIAQALHDRHMNRKIPMWVEDDGASTLQFLTCRRGLLIRPLAAGPQRDAVVHRFHFLGRLMGQALREGFIVPLPLAEEFFAMVLGEQLGPSSLPRPGSASAGELTGVLADFAAELASGSAAETAAGRGSPQELQAWRQEQAERIDFGERFLAAPGEVGEDSAVQHQPMSFQQYTSLLGACFLETGLSGAPLCPGGDDIPVTVDNVREFAERATEFWFQGGVSAQVEAFRTGLDDVFPVGSLAAFSPHELREMFCGEDRIEWDEQALLAHLHPGGGLGDKSPTFKYLVAVLLEMNQADRSRFLDFVTSCPRLPPGGITKLHVDVFPDVGANKGCFPRSRACANQLYLPPYNSKEELEQKLLEAIHCSAGHHEQRVRDQ